jgi:uncharacterized protein
MKVHINQVPVEGLHREGEESASILDLKNERTQAAGDIRYALDIGISGNSFFATGSLELDFNCECDRCLEKFRYPLRVADFAMQEDIDGRETIDLTPAIREDILLSLPSYPRCDWNGEKVCPGPKQIASSKQAASAPEPSAWDELKKLKIQSR